MATAYKRHWTEEEKEKFSVRCKNKPKFSCWLCGKEYQIPGLKIHMQWHERNGDYVDWSLLPLKPVLPEEERKRLGSERSSKAAMGNKRARANKGKKHSEEQNKRHSEIMSGRKMSDEAKRKLSESHKRKWNSLSDGEKQERIEKTLPQTYNPSTLEIKLSKQLEDNEIYFISHRWFHFGDGEDRKIFQPDFYLPEDSLIIEVQGCYWHGCEDCYGPKSLKKHVLDDEIRKEIFEEEGYTVIFVWEHEINSEDFDVSQLLNKQLLAA